MMVQEVYSPGLDCMVSVVVAGLGVTRSWLTVIAGRPVVHGVDVTVTVLVTVHDGGNV